MFTKDKSWMNIILIIPCALQNLMSLCTQKKKKNPHMSLEVRTQELYE